MRILAHCSADVQVRVLQWVLRIQAVLIEARTANEKCGGRHVATQGLHGGLGIALAEVRVLTLRTVEVEILNIQIRGVPMEAVDVTSV